MTAQNIRPISSCRLSLLTWYTCIYEVWLLFIHDNKWAANFGKNVFSWKIQGTLCFTLCSTGLFFFLTSTASLKVSKSRKQIIWIRNSSKKRTKNGKKYPEISKDIFSFFLRFIFGRLRTQKNSFEIYWPLKVESGSSSRSEFHHHPPGWNCKILSKNYAS